jgi:aminopeptidase C
MNKWWNSSRPSALVSSVILLGACAAPLSEEHLEDSSSSSDALVDVPQSSVERQAIGNCWIYAHASWIESMHLTAEGEEIDLSQSYWTYWHWFEQITGQLTSSEKEISTGGNWSTANNLVRRYGLMHEAAFVTADTSNEMSARQASALRTINASLASGALAAQSARRDRALVRAELDAAWELSADMVSTLDQVFGPAVERRLDRTGTRRAVLAGTPVLDPRELAVAYVELTADARVEPVHATLTQAMSEWGYADYARGDRETLVRTQRALHARQPVIMTWDVDFNAMEKNPGELVGSFNLDTLARAGGPGSQGGHMVVIEDYEVDTSEFGRLHAGETLDPALAEDAAKLAAALEDDSRVRFFRVKNSWGTARPDRGSAPGFPGYHDLYMDYLDGPIAWCPDRKSSEDDCSGESTPLSYLILPPGF